VQGALSSSLGVLTLFALFIDCLDLSDPSPSTSMLRAFLCCDNSCISRNREQRSSGSLSTASLRLILSVARAFDFSALSAFSNSVNARALVLPFFFFSLPTTVVSLVLQVAAVYQSQSGFVLVAVARISKSCLFWPAMLLASFSDPSPYG